MPSNGPQGLRELALWFDVRDLTYATSHMEHVGDDQVQRNLRQWADELEALTTERTAREHAEAQRDAVQTLLSKSNFALAQSDAALRHATEEIAALKAMLYDWQDAARQSLPPVKPVYDLAPRREWSGTAEPFGGRKVRREQ